MVQYTGPVRPNTENSSAEPLHLLCVPVTSTAWVTPLHTDSLTDSCTLQLYYWLPSISEFIILYPFIFFSAFVCDFLLCADYFQPFTDDFPRADIHQMLAPDILHQLIKGAFKDHLVTWVTEYIVIVHGDKEAKKILDDIDYQSVENNIL